MTVDASARHQPYAPMLLPPLESPKWHGPVRALALGMSSVTATVLSLVLFVTYIGIGALAHDTHFSPAWALMSTALVWAGPAQIILISTLASGATIVQSAIAVTVSAIRLFPMVVAVMPMLRTPQTKRRQAHPGGAFHRRDVVGRVLPLPAPGAARAADRLRPWAGLRPHFDRPLRNHHRLRARRQPFADLDGCDPVVDAAGVLVLRRPQLPRTRRHSGARAGARALSACRAAQQRPRYPGQWRGRGTIAFCVHKWREGP
jgi:hypothetical protein